MGGMHGARSIVIKYVRLLEILSLPRLEMNEEIHRIFSMEKEKYIDKETFFWNGKHLSE